MLCKLKKIHRAQIPIVRLIFQRLCDDYQCLILVFSVIYFDSWEYTGGAPVPVFEKFSSLFSFLPFPLFSFLFFTFFLSFLFFWSLSLGAPLSQGPLDMHCPSMPPSRYATDFAPPNSSGAGYAAACWPGTSCIFPEVRY